MSRLWLTVAELQPPNEGFILMLWQLDKLHYNCSCSSGAEERGSHARKWPASCWARWPGCWKWAMIEIESLEPLESLESLEPPVSVSNESCNWLRSASPDWGQIANAVRPPGDSLHLQWRNIISRLSVGAVSTFSQSTLSQASQSRDHPTSAKVLTNLWHLFPENI